MATSDSYYDRHPQRVEIIGSVLFHGFLYLPFFWTGFPPILFSVTLSLVLLWWYTNFKHRYFLARHIRSQGGRLIEVKWRPHTLSFLVSGWARIGDITYLDENQQVRQTQVLSRLDHKPELFEDQSGILR
jgi:hypothetical protein